MLGLVLAILGSLAGLLLFVVLAYKAGPAGWGIILLLWAAIIGGLYRSCIYQG